MFSSRQYINDLLAHGAIDPTRAEDAMRAAGVFPDRQAWHGFIDRLLLWLSGLALALAAMFFIAFNWVELGRFGKFVLVEAAIALAVAGYWFLGHRGIWGKVSLLVATILLGVLLALFGQTYQTGADPWQLFFNWALMMLPWALVGRFPAIWLVWIGLLNMSITLYIQALGMPFGRLASHERGILWLTFILNMTALLTWEALTRKFAWHDERWAVRIVAVMAGVPVTYLSATGISDASIDILPSIIVWGGAMGVVYVIYRRIKRDLFMLAGMCLSLIIVASTLLGRLFWGLGGVEMLMFVTVIGMGAGAANWLKSVQREWQS